MLSKLPQSISKQFGHYRAQDLDDEPIHLDSISLSRPSNRQISFRWLTGAFLTMVMATGLMGVALYTALDGQESPVHVINKLELSLTQSLRGGKVNEKSNRNEFVTYARTEREIISATVKKTKNDRNIIVPQEFIRINASLASSPLDNIGKIPAYNPSRILAKRQKKSKKKEIAENTQIYGSRIEGEVAVKLSDFNTTPAVFTDIDRLSDQKVLSSISKLYTGKEDDFFEISGHHQSADNINIVENELQINSNLKKSIVENVIEVEKNISDEKVITQFHERFIRIDKPKKINDVIQELDLTEDEQNEILGELKPIIRGTTLTPKYSLRVLYGPNTQQDKAIPHRISFYDRSSHIISIARADDNNFVLGRQPGKIEFIEEKNVQPVNIGNLPSLYKAIYQTGYKQGLSKDMIEQIIAIYAYDLNLRNRIRPTDKINILHTVPEDADEEPELLYVSLKVGKKIRDYYRFQTPDKVVDFYDKDGQTGKKFLLRRPVRGGGKLTSGFGWRRHPISKRRKLHRGIDLKAKYRAPIIAAGDGVITKAKWEGGYGRHIEIRHRNGYVTTYSHLSGYRKGIRPGVRVPQGYVIGYMGSTGYSTGTHLHYEIRINKKAVNPLRVRLPRGHSLAKKHRREFEKIKSQYQELMSKDIKGTETSANNT